MPEVNRITSALTTSTHATSPSHCWGESYNPDAWGNLQSIAATTNSNYTGCSEESGFSATADGNNHLNIFSYDSSGNTQSDGVNSYTWDAESQLKTAAGVTYAYDGDGRRVYKSNGKLYWYGSGGDILAETDASGNTTAEYIFFGGKRIAMLPAGSTPIYYVEDMLGTSRVTTTNTGTVCYDADFYPYGGERPYTSTCPQNYKFEGKERDTETGNDEFGARYYSNRFGRWLSADWSSVSMPVPYANLTNPQTLNLYSMVADDPESFADLDGHTSFFEARIGGTGSWGPDIMGASDFSMDDTGEAETTQQLVADNYNVDKFSHGDPHIDRVDDNGKLVGRYNEDGTGIKHKGKTPPSIPNSDKEKFSSAADKLRKYKEQKAKAEAEGKQKQQESPQQKKSPTRSNPFNMPSCAGPCDGFLPVPGIFPGLPFPQVAPIPELIPIPV